MKNITALKIGVLGGGQLGRMLIQSAMDFNLDISILDPDKNAPCKDLVSDFTVGALTDYDTVIAFGTDKDLLTIEIENVNTAALKELEKLGKKVFPQPHIIELIQDKRVQKEFYKSHNIPTADFILVEDKKDVAAKVDKLPIVNKLGTEGYDGRGVQILRTQSDLDKAFDKPGLLEELIDFEKELSVIVARNESGQCSTFPLVELVFHPEANLVEFLFAPADVPSLIAEKASKLAVEVIEKLDMVGLLAVEMFLTKEGEILVNEIAPRTHNSGHQSIEANITSQFEQHLRAILDLPLGATDQLIPAAMINLLGAEGYTGDAIYEGIDDLMKERGAHIHLYGKKITKPFRKMGHITVTDEDLKTLKVRINTIKNCIKVIA
ncbi:MAG: 5-(carboxyamino)imidazole ribonucleotide synthase [Cyclobacteriaceae bacterium]|jgi:5-(carboxyamino)imidazole ribonucleotide synthase